MWFLDFVTVFKESYKCQTSHNLGRDQLPKPLLLPLGCYISMTLNIFTEKGTPFFLGIFFPLKSWLFHIHDLGYFHRKRLPFLARVYFNKKVIPSALYFILGVFFTHCYAVFRHHSSFCWQQLEDHQARLFPRRTCTMPTRKIKKSYKKVLALLHVHDLGYFHRKKDPPFFCKSLGFILTVIYPSTESTF